MRGVLTIQWERNGKTDESNDWLAVFPGWRRVQPAWITEMCVVRRVAVPRSTRDRPPVTGAQELAWCRLPGITLMKQKRPFHSCLSLSEMDFLHTEVSGRLAKVKKRWNSERWTAPFEPLSRWQMCEELWHGFWKVLTRRMQKRSRSWRTGRPK